MANKITEDPRIDPRIKEQFKNIEFPELSSGNMTREDMIAKVDSEEGKMELMIYEAIFNDPALDEAISSEGLQKKLLKLLQNLMGIKSSY